MQKSLLRFCRGKRMPVKTLALLLLSIATTSIYAQSYKSLNDKVSIRFDKSNGLDIVKALQQQTPYTFVYDPEFMQQCSVGAVKFAETPVSTVLEYLDNNAPIDIELTTSKTIALKKGKADKPANRANGRVTGKVLDTKNEPLPGVSIQASNGTGTVSNIDGTFDLQLEPGTYTLTFSFISFDQKTVTDVIVTSKAIVPLNVVMKNNSSKLKEVTVTATYKRNSVEGLYAIQKNNAGISDGISAEQIGRTPDKNVGETLKRVSGLSTLENKYVVVRGLSERYNQAILNGQIMPSTELNRKNFNYDIIPTNIIENVTVVKTLTPDRSAEFGGGLIEVNTTDIPTEDFFNASIGGSYNNKTTGKTFFSLPLEGQEYLAKVSTHRAWLGSTDWKTKADLVAAGDKADKSKPFFENNWIPTYMKAPLSPNFNFSGGKVFNNHFGFVASLGYRNTFATQDVTSSRDGFMLGTGGDGKDSLLFNGSRYGFTTNINGLWGVGYRNKKHKISFQGLYLQVLDQQLTMGYGTHDDLGPNTMRLQDITTVSKILQNQLKGEHLIGNKGIKVKWLAGYTTLDKLRPDNHFYMGNYYKDSTYAVTDLSVRGAYTTGREGTLRWYSRAREKNFNWDIAVSAPFDLGPLKNIAKIGSAGWNKDRTFYVANSSSRAMGSEYYIPLDEYFTDSSTTTKLTDGGKDFKANVTLSSWYAMLDNKWGKFRLVWGARAEYYNLNDVNSMLQETIDAQSGQVGRPIDASELYNREPNLRFFPSANLTYSLTPAMNFRLAYSESIIRPDIRELSYFREYDFELGGDYWAEGVVHSTNIKNYDFRYEWYPAPGDVISFSLYQKDMAYPMEIYKQGGNRVYIMKNNKSAVNKGLEVELRKSFAFTKLPVLKNLTVYGNFSYMDSKVRRLSTEVTHDPDDIAKLHLKETVGDEEPRPQSGASNLMLNAGLFYDLPIVSLSLNYNYVTNRTFRPADLWQFSLYEQPLKALDAQVAFKFLKNRLEAKLSISNLLNSFNLIYEKTFNEYPDQWKDVGKSDMKYQEGKDFINFRGTPGRAFSTTISYRF
ncbi:TonB-dependent receptor [Chitinophaga silvatica]|uniref:TonB-dependent receptor n=1 Tax=Chitinophaga silvatica TaxID=2282649 RepID=A0A3E1Y9M7_9BACT|nr:TonB-dependent receptor [Chitinophaga silvatica]RFS22409.1 TonB-dependent receptor [Chitinophaga silvatica]